MQQQGRQAQEGLERGGCEKVRYEERHIRAEVGGETKDRRVGVHYCDMHGIHVEEGSGRGLAVEWVARDEQVADIPGSSRNAEGNHEYGEVRKTFPRCHAGYEATDHEGAAVLAGESAQPRRSSRDSQCRWV